MRKTAVYKITMTVLWLHHIIDPTPYPRYISGFVLADLRARRVGTCVLRDRGVGYGAIEGCVCECEEGCEEEEY
jgi:hypothetical protein